MKESWTYWQTEGASGEERKVRWCRERRSCIYWWIHLSDRGRRLGPVALSRLFLVSLPVQPCWTTLFSWIYCVLYPLCACSLCVNALSHACLLKFCIFIILWPKRLNCETILDTLIYSCLLSILCLISTYLTRFGSFSYLNNYTEGKEYFLYIYIYICNLNI